MEEVFRVSGYIGKRERKRRQETDTRHLIGVQALTEYGLVTYGQETLVYFLIKPANLSVLSEASIGRRIYALMTVLKGVAEVEMLCLNSRESFEENKLFLRRRMEEEQNPVVRSLLEKDQKHLALKPVIDRLHRCQSQKLFDFFCLDIFLNTGFF